MSFIIITAVMGYLHVAVFDQDSQNKAPLPRTIKNESQNKKNSLF